MFKLWIFRRRGTKRGDHGVHGRGHHHLRGVGQQPQGKHWHGVINLYFIFISGKSLCYCIFFSGLTLGGVGGQIILRRTRTRLRWSSTTTSEPTWYFFLAKKQFCVCLKMGFIYFQEEEEERRRRMVYLGIGPQKTLSRQVCYNNKKLLVPALEKKITFPEYHPHGWGAGPAAAAAATPRETIADKFVLRFVFDDDLVRLFQNLFFSFLLWIFLHQRFRLNGGFVGRGRRAGRIRRRGARYEICKKQQRKGDLINIFYSRASEEARQNQEERTEAEELQQAGKRNNILIFAYCFWWILYFFLRSTRYSRRNRRLLMPRLWRPKKAKTLRRRRKRKRKAEEGGQLTFEETGKWYYTSFWKAGFSSRLPVSRIVPFAPHYIAIF